MNELKAAQNLSINDSIITVGDYAFRKDRNPRLYTIKAKVEYIQHYELSADSEQIATMKFKAKFPDGIEGKTCEIISVEEEQDELGEDK